MADHEVILEDKYLTKSVLEGAALDYNMRFKLDFSASDAAHTASASDTPVPLIDSSLTTNADTLTVTLFSKTATQIISRAAIHVETAATVSGNATATLGSDGDPNDFIATTVDIETAGFYEDLPGGLLDASATDHRALAADDIVIQIVPDGSTAPADITAGVVWVYLQVNDLNDLAKL